MFLDLALDFLLDVCERMEERNYTASNLTGSQNTPAPKILI